MERSSARLRSARISSGRFETRLVKSRHIERRSSQLWQSTLKWQNCKRHQISEPKKLGRHLIQFLGVQLKLEKSAIHLVHHQNRLDSLRNGLLRKKVDSIYSCSCKLIKRITNDFCTALTPFFYKKTVYKNIQAEIFEKIIISVRTSQP